MKAANMFKMTALTALATMGLPAFATCPTFDDGDIDAEWTCRSILPMDNLTVSASCDATVAAENDVDGETFHHEGDPAVPNIALADSDREVWVRWTISELYSELHTDATPAPGDVAAFGRVTSDFVYSGITYDSAMASAALVSAASAQTQNVVSTSSLRCHELPAGVTDIDLFELEVETAVYATCSPVSEAEASADIMMSINPQLCWQN